MSEQAEPSIRVNPLDLDERKVTIAGENCRRETKRDLHRNTKLCPWIGVHAVQVESGEEGGDDSPSIRPRSIGAFDQLRPGSSLVHDTPIHDRAEGRAEGGGFEPPGLITRRFSRPLQSSALPSLRHLFNQSPNSIEFKLRDRAAKTASSTRVLSWPSCQRRIRRVSEENHWSTGGRSSSKGTGGPSAEGLETG